ncbi:MAG TPA: response regulator transcription factor [Polyangiaceae bacterium]|nr:response regulator transcription factor [Polyangiaceae bacterium]
MIRVLIADDHAVVRRGVRQILEETSDIEVAGEAATAGELWSKVLEGRFDAVVLDVNIPGRSGLELLGDIKRERPELPVLILTVHSEEQYAVRALKAGASGFLTKESAPEKLVDAVRRIAEGRRFITPEVAEKLASSVARGDTGPLHEALSDREFQILKMIASGKTVSQIGRELALSVKTISTHRTRILKKMNLKTNSELTHYAMTNGLME